MRQALSLLCLLFFLGTSKLGGAQTETHEQASRQESPEDVRYEVVSAGVTRWGDTGFFDVFSAYTTRKYKFAVAGFTDNIDREVFNMDISNLGVTLTFGVTNRIEVFGRFDVQRRILARDPTSLAGQKRRLTDACFDPEVARSVDPLLFLEVCGTNPELIVELFGKPPSFYNDEPRVYRRRSVGLGDVWLGGKWNLLSEYRDDPLALGVRAFIKLPTADDEAGLGTGAISGGGHVVVSKNVGEQVETCYYAGFRGNANGDLPIEIGNAIEWGMAAGFPRKSVLRGTVELTGTVFTGSTQMYLEGLLIEQPNPVDLLLSLNVQLRKEFFLSAGWRTNLNYDVSGETASGFNFRIGYHPGIRGKAREEGR